MVSLQIDWNFGVVDSIILLWPVGGLEHELYFPYFSIWENHLPIDELHHLSRWLLHHQPTMVTTINPPFNHHWTTFMDVHGRSGIFLHILDDDPRGFAKIIRISCWARWARWVGPGMTWRWRGMIFFAVFMFSIRWFWPITIISIWVGYWWHDKDWISSGSWATHFAERGAKIKGSVLYFNCFMF